MGAMGYGVYDNDNAMDFRAVIARQLVKHLADSSPEQIRVLADLANGEFGYTMEYQDYPENKGELVTLRQRMIEALETIPNEWYESWRDPDLMHYEVNHTLRKLKAVE